MDILNELNDGKKLIDKLYSVFTNVKARLELNFHNYRVHLTRSSSKNNSFIKTDTNYSFDEKFDSIRETPPLSTLRFKNFLDTIHKRVKKPITNTKNATNGASQVKETAYYTSAGSFFYSKRRMKLVKDSEKDKEHIDAEIRNEEKKVAEKLLSHNRTVKSYVGGFDISFTNKFLRKIKDKSVGAKNTNKLNCFLIKQVNLKAIKRSLV